MSAREFCDQCGVSMDLHPWPEDRDDPGCIIATMKAETLAAFDRIFARGSM